MKKRIVLIDHDEEILQTNSLILRGTGKYDIIGVFTSMDEAITFFMNTAPDIILMDVQLRGEIDSIEGIRMVKDKFPSILILILTNVESQECVFRCLKAGAVGYLIKSFDLTFLIDALSEVELGGSPLSYKISRMVIGSFFENPRSPLTQREKQILNNLSEGKSFSEIADELNISSSTSRVHIRNIYAKLKVHSKAEAIALAKRESYL